MPFSALNWPPPFSLKRSGKSKAVQLKICRRHGLQLVLPKRFNEKNLPDILLKNRAWIERQWERLQPNPIEEKNLSLPKEIILPAINTALKISYIHETHKTDHRVFFSNEHHLKIYGNHEHALRTLNIIAKWIHFYSKNILPKWLEKISHRTELSFRSVTVRDTSTRWGSCSAKKRISLNYKLLFLPKEIVEYIMIHELSHTVHLNHSQKFWQLVEAHCPLYLKHRQKLKKEAHLYVPIWCEK